MRVLHTSDWHLGHTLRGEVTREHEHAVFLAWLLETCVREAADALVITGDVFDSSTPPASAERMWFEFLAAARRSCPAMDIVAIAGNHDSPARLGAASAVLRELDVHVIGGLPRTADGAIDLDRVLIPIAGGRGLVAAVPFLRPVDLPPDLDDPLEAIYAEVIAGARARRMPEQTLIATGHLYVAGADAAFLSERRVCRESIRYAGAPISLALDEAGYRHQIAAVDFAASGRLLEIRQLLVPQAIEILRIPRRGAAALGEVLAALDALPPRIAQGEDLARPYLEVVVALDKPEPKLRVLVETALEGKRARLIQLHVEHTGDGAALGDRVSARRLAELDPREVFMRLWARDHAEPPSADVLAGFDRLLSEVSGDTLDPEAS